MEIKKIDENVDGTEVHKKVCEDMKNLKPEFLNMINLMESSINGMLFTVKESLLFNEFENKSLESATKGLIESLREIVENGCENIKEFNKSVDKMNKYQQDIAYWDGEFDARQKKSEENAQNENEPEKKRPKP